MVCLLNFLLWAYIIFLFLPIHCLLVKLSIPCRLLLFNRVSFLTVPCRRLKAPSIYNIEGHKKSKKSISCYKSILGHLHQDRVEQKLLICCKCWTWGTYTCSNKVISVTVLGWVICLEPNWLIFGVTKAQRLFGNRQPTKLAFPLELKVNVVIYFQFHIYL